MNVNVDYTLGGSLDEIKNALLLFDSLLAQLDYSLIDDGEGSMSTIHAFVLQQRNDLNTAYDCLKNTIKSMKSIDSSTTGNVL